MHLIASQCRSDRAVEEAVALRTRELDQALARVEERRRFTETILNAMVSGILVTDARGAVTFANLAALRTLGTSLADCVGRPVVEIFAHNVSRGMRGRTAPLQPHQPAPAPGRPCLRGLHPYLVQEQGR